MTAAQRAARADRLAALIGEADPGRLRDELLGQRMLALAGSRALAIAGAALSAEFERAVAGDVTANRSRGLALEALAVHVASRLEEAGVETLPLKGPFLAQRLYGDPGMRSTHDLDLLIHPRDVRPALEVLDAAGFAVDGVGRRDGGSDRPDLHYVLRHRGGRLTRIELHWRVHWYEEEFSRRMLERSQVGDVGLREAAPEDELAALLLFYARDGLLGLRYAADLAAWWDRYGDRAGEPPLARCWNDHPMLRRPLEAAANAAAAIVALPAERLLPSAAVPGRRTRMAVRLANWAAVGELDQLHANVHLVDALVSPRSAIPAFLRRNVMLGPDAIKQTYRLPEDAVLRRRAWLVGHAPKTLVRYVLGLLGALRPGPERLAGSGRGGS